VAVSTDSVGKLARRPRRCRANQGGFLLHYLDKLVYPNISVNVLTTAAVIVCVSNLAFYARQLWVSRRAHR
jgi:hypothetical protein